MKTYRNKHTVEALRWVDTDANREVFTAWFEEHDAMFTTHGSEAVLPVEDGIAALISEGDWILFLFLDDTFIAMSDELFKETYEEIP